MEFIRDFLSPGWMTVLGGFLVQTIATVSLFGNLTTPISSYLRLYDGSITYGNTMMIYATCVGAQGLSMTLGGSMSKKYGVKPTVLLGGSLVSLSYITSACSTTLFQFILGYGVLLGMGIGFASSAPIICAMKWMPDHKGVIAGIIVAGSGVGGLVYGLFASTLYNPNLLNTDELYEGSLYFSNSSGVPQRVPYMMMKLGILFEMITIVAFLLVQDPPSDDFIPIVDLEMIEKSEIDEKSEKVIASLREQRLREVSSSSFGASTAKSHHAAVAHEAGDDHLCHLQLTPAELVSSPLAWHLVTCFITTTAPSVYFAGTFKTYGADYINNQSFLTNIANICNLFNSLGRIFWGEIADLIGPVQTLKIVSGVASFIISTYFYATSTKSEFLFSFYTCAIMFCIGGDFSLYLPVTMEIFGEANAGQNYGLIYACYTLFSVLNIVVLSGLGVQFSIASTTMGLLTLAGFLNLILFSIHAKIYDVQVSSKRMRVRSSIFSGKFDHLDHGPNAHH